MKSSKQTLEDMKANIKNIKVTLDYFETKINNLINRELIRKEREWIKTNTPKCPKCKTRNVRSRMKDNTLFCRTCGNIFKLNQKEENKNEHKKNS